jgi:cytoskeletal protein RodZ
MAYLQSIEADHYPGLPHAVYLRSYLTQYAGQMGIDPKQVVAGYLKRYQDWKARQRSS